MAEVNHEILKRCTKCKRDLPIIEFWKNKNGRDGLHARCKSCANEDSKIIRQTDKAKETRYKYRQTKKYKIAIKKYHQSEKGKEALKRVYDKYSKTDKFRENRKNYWQTPEMKYKKKIWAKQYAQSEKGRATIHRWSHNRRLFERGKSNLTADEWEGIKKKYKYRCAYCGEKRPLTKDCIVPINKGGSYTKLNVIPACLSCNCSKKDTILPMLTTLLAPDPVGEMIKADTVCGILSTMVYKEDNNIIDIATKTNYNNGCNMAFLEAISKSIKIGLKNGVRVAEYINTLQNMPCNNHDKFQGDSIKSCPNAISIVLGEIKENNYGCS